MFTASLGFSQKQSGSLSLHLWPICPHIAIFVPSISAVYKLRCQGLPQAPPTRGSHSLHLHALGTPLMGFASIRTFTLSILQSPCACIRSPLPCCFASSPIWSYDLSMRGVVPYRNSRQRVVLFPPLVGFRGWGVGKKRRLRGISGGGGYFGGVSGGALIHGDHLRERKAQVVALYRRETQE